jgi:hypothetical protein
MDGLPFSIHEMNVDSLDPMQMLADVLSLKVSKKIDTQIRERVAAGVCVCCASNPLFRDGNCRQCDHQVTKALAGLSKSGQIKFLNGLYQDGLRLRPYSIREYRKPLSEIEKRARA